MLPEGTIFRSQYQLNQKIASGRFGDVYLATIRKNNKNVAMKVQLLETKYPRLAHEVDVYKILKGGVGIPKIYYFGVEQGYCYFVMKYVGPSLEDLFNFCGRLFSMKTVLALADQMISCIEYLHSKGFVHRDISPTNFVMSKRDTLYIVNFGLAKNYRDFDTGVHIPYQEGKRHAGGARYASVNGHLGIAHSRRDDLESLGYVLMYFLRGSLPWQDMIGKNKLEKYQNIMETKLTTTIETLCEGFPPEFVKYFNYCRDLQFNEAPDYNYLRRLFRTISPELDGSFEYDWNAFNKQTLLK